MITIPGTRTDHPPLPDFPFSWDGTRVPAEVAELRAATPPCGGCGPSPGTRPGWWRRTSCGAQVLKDDRFSLKDTSAPGVPRQYALTIPPEVVNNMGNITGAGLRRAVMKALNPKAPGLAEWLRAEAHRLVDLLVAEGRRPTCAGPSASRTRPGCTAASSASRRPRPRPSCAAWTSPS
ncbi:hypothetical protein GCM10017687_06750 [Streptomyces echinatus]|uniref:hypothetical protein n=1 Tax=Streptomyces echinatus TaxID=67293 RepID=UPI0031F18B33